jgi:hypothetical protein
MMTTGLNIALDPRWYTPCMANLEKLAWIDAFVIEGYGVRVGVRVNDPAAIPLLIARLPPATRAIPGAAASGIVVRVISVILGGAGPRRGVRTFNMAYADHDEIARSRDLEDVFAAYDTHVRMALAQHSRERMFIHGGAVGVNGRAILFPGYSLAGKTSLVAALISSGAEYLSDEYAVFDADGMVHPFAKPLSLRATPTARQVEKSAEALGGRVATRPLPVGAVVMTRYREGAKWRPRRLSPATAAMRIMEHMVGARTDPTHTVEMLGRLAERAPAIQSVRPDMEQALAGLLNTLNKLRL